ncbi:MAG: molybdenum cofactor biosynthesis protein MoaE [Actinomycetota bacterium]
MTAEITTRITDERLDVGAAIAHVAGPELGGIGVFVGTVRDTSSIGDQSDKTVVRLDYEAHPSLAEDALAQVAFDATKKWDIRRVLAIHRTGVCELGEPTVVVVCGAPHRSDALEACRWIIDSIKHTVPIWKREVYSDGSAWVGANSPDGGAR